MQLTIILGTAREGRYSEYAANFVKEILSKDDTLEIEFIDIKDYLSERTIPSWEDNPKLSKVKNILNKSDGFVFVSPEYGHGYPGELKIFIDGIGSEFAKKPAGICGVSNGDFGGARMVEQLHNILISNQMVCLRNTVYFQNIDKIVDEKSGKLTDKKDHYEKRIEGMLEELLWYANALKEARESDK